VNSLPKTVTRQHRGCDLNLGPSVPESSTLTSQLLSRPSVDTMALQTTKQVTFSDKKYFSQTNMKQNVAVQIQGKQASIVLQMQLQCMLYYNKVILVYGTISGAQF